jgi:ribonuclease J
VVLEEPEIITRGFIHSRAVDDLLDAARQMIREAVRNGNGNLQKDLQEAVKAFLYNRTRRRPMVFVTINRA